MLINNALGKCIVGKYLRIPSAFIVVNTFIVINTSVLGLAIRVDQASSL